MYKWVRTNDCLEELLLNSHNCSCSLCQSIVQVITRVMRLSACDVFLYKFMPESASVWIHVLLHFDFTMCLEFLNIFLFIVSALQDRTILGTLVCVKQVPSLLMWPINLSACQTFVQVKWNKKKECLHKNWLYMQAG